MLATHQPLAPRPGGPMATHDLVIRGGTVVDGTGAPARTADVAITDGVVTEVGPGRRRGGRRRSTPTARSSRRASSTSTPTTTARPPGTSSSRRRCWHGVTTVVMGNCGVGFAPVAPDRHEWLIGLMEGVEDIPGAALSAGIQWGWETFPEFLDALDARAARDGPRHAGAPRRRARLRDGRARARATSRPPPTTSRRWPPSCGQGIEAGALGFSTSRTLAHRAIDGEPVPGTFAAEDELFGIGRVLGELGTGVFELAPAGALGEDLAAPEREMDWMRRLSAAIGRPVTFALTQNNADPTSWKRLLDLSAAAAAEGVPRATAGARPHRVAAARLPDVPPARLHPGVGRGRARPAPVAGAGGPHQRPTPTCAARIVADAARLRGDPIVMGFMRPQRHLRARRPARLRAGARAQRHAPSPPRAAWTSGSCCSTCSSRTTAAQLLNAPVLNYTDGNLDAAGEMLQHPTSAFGLGDGGAHAGQTCDASTTTFLLVALGARPRPRPAHRRGGRAQDDPGHRHALRPRRPRRARARLRRRRQRDRPRAPPAPPARAGERPARRRQPPHPAGRRLRHHDQVAACPPSSAARTPAPGPARCCAAPGERGAQGDGGRVLGGALRPRLAAHPLVLRPRLDLLRRAHRTGVAPASGPTASRPGCGSGSRASSATSTDPASSPRAPAASSSPSTPRCGPGRPARRWRCRSCPCSRSTTGSSSSGRTTGTSRR